MEIIDKNTQDLYCIHSKRVDKWKYELTILFQRSEELDLQRNSCSQIEIIHLMEFVKDFLSKDIIVTIMYYVIFTCICIQSALAAVIHVTE